MSRNLELQLEDTSSFDSELFVKPSLASLAKESQGGDFAWATAEAQRLVQQVFLRQSEKPPRVVVFAGIDHGNGCSGISGAVADSLARNCAGQVCLLEANFRSPALPSMFGTANHFGLTNALVEAGPVRTFARRLVQPNLWLISTGSLSEDSPSLLTPDRLKGRLAELRAEFEFVVIDAAPLTRYADAIALGQLTDGLILVLEANSTRRDAAKAVATTLRSSNINILAAVLNKRTFPIPERIYRNL